MRHSLILALLAVGVLGNGSPEAPPAFLLKWGSPGSGPGQFRHPHGMTADAAGNLYVADAYNDRVQ
jgi:hypothetical protein